MESSGIAGSTPYMWRKCTKILHLHIPNYISVGYSRESVRLVGQWKSHSLDNVVSKAARALQYT